MIKLMRNFTVPFFFFPFFYTNDNGYINAIHFFFGGKIEDDLKHVVGSETTRYGLLNSFSMWQHKTLNKRLILVLFNEIVTTLYQTDDLNKHVK